MLQSKEDRQPPLWWGVMLVLISGISWGNHGVIIKLSYKQGFDFVKVIALEFGLGAIIFIGIILLTGWRKHWPVNQQKTFWFLMLFCGIASGVLGLSLFRSFQVSPVPIGATAFFVYMPVVFLVNAVFKKQKFHGAQWLAMILILFGACLGTKLFSVSFVGNGEGIVYGVVAALCYSGIFLCIDRIGPHSTPEFRSLTFCVIGLLCVVIFASTKEHALDYSHISNFHLIAYGSFLAVFGQAVPVLSLMRGLPIVGSTLGSVLASTELPVAIILSALILKEHVVFSQVIGVVLILGAIALNQWASARVENRPSPS